MYKHSFKYLFIAFFLVGCVVTSPSPSESKTRELSKLLQTLDRSIPVEASLQLSHDIFNETAKLTKEFELTSPPWFHNFLVNVGVRKKGLCYHWSDALYVHFLEKNDPYFEFHLVGAHIGEYFFEHNALVAVAKNGKVLEGVLVDPWRDSGTLYFSKVNKDKKYKWVHRSSRGCLR